MNTGLLPPAAEQDKHIQMSFSLRRLSERSSPVPSGEDLLRSDKDLVRDYCRGDESALNEIAARHRSSVVRMAACIIGDAGEAEDIAQELFVHLPDSLRRFRGRSSLTTYLYSIARNLCYRHIRTAMRHRTRHTALNERAAHAAAEPMSGGGPDPALRRILSAALGEIHAKYREPLLLYELQQLSYREIADVLCIREGTVKSRIAKAKTQLAALLGWQRRWT